MKNIVFLLMLSTTACLVAAKPEAPVTVQPATATTSTKTYTWDDAGTPAQFREFPNAKQKWEIERDSTQRKAVVAEIKRLRSAPTDEVYAFSAAKDFPGVPDNGTPIVTRDVTLNPDAGGWQSTGLYVLPGVPVTIRFPEGLAPKEGEKNLGRIIVGCHTDRLGDRHKTWSRLPEISYSWNIDKIEMRVASPMGGLLYIDLRTKRLGPINVKVSDVVSAPMFVKGKTTADEWKMMLAEHPAPWGELVGERLIISLPLSDLRQVPDPEKIITYADSGMKLQDWLIAWDVTAPERLKTPMRLVTDRQVSAGSGHSGYPTMGGLDWGRPFRTGSFIDKGSWGLWHEVGHNHQSGPFRLPGMGEVTVNIFSLIAQMKVHQVPLRETWGGFRNIDKAVDEFMKSDKTYQEMGSAHGLRLWFWAEMIETFGFEPFREMSIAFSKDGYKNNASEIEKWSWTLKTLSKATGKNLAPFFAKWKIAVDDASKDAVKTLPAWSGAAK